MYILHSAILLKSQNALPVFLPLNKIALILSGIGLKKHAFALSLPVFPLADIPRARVVMVDSMTIKHVVFPYLLYIPVADVMLP